MEIRAKHAFTAMADRHPADELADMRDQTLVVMSFTTFSNLQNDSRPLTR
jgi:hypothetical protein